MNRTVIMLAVVAAGLLALYVQVFPFPSQGAGSFVNYIPIISRQMTGDGLPTPVPPTPPHGLAASPAPIISRGKQAVSSSGNAGKAVNGIYRDLGWQPSDPTYGNPQWLAINIGVGPSRLLLNWVNSASFNLDQAYYGSPGDYKIMVSADSTNGSDGTWTEAIPMVTGNTLLERMHSFSFSGEKWVKLVVYSKAVNSQSGISIDEVDVHDISNEYADDIWFMMGDSITAYAFGRSSNSTLYPSFADIIHSAHPDFYPAFANGGIGGESSAAAVQRIDRWMQLFPDAKYWAISYGSVDAYSYQPNPNPDTSGFRSNLQTVITKLKAAGKIPILPRIPYSTDHRDNIPLYNKVIDELTTTNGLVKGPDLYSWFKQHPEQLFDGLHPNADGCESINKLWAEALLAAGIYSGAK